VEYTAGMVLATSADISTRWREKPGLLALATLWPTTSEARRFAMSPERAV
jgi:hypothetical protein